VSFSAFWRTILHNQEMGFVRIKLHFQAAGAPNWDFRQLGYFTDFNDQMIEIIYDLLNNCCQQDLNAFHFL